MTQDDLNAAVAAGNVNIVQPNPPAQQDPNADDPLAGYRPILDTLRQQSGKTLEFNNGTVSVTATIDWSQARVQYVTLSANTTFTFTGAVPGGRYLLHVAGAYTPTFPATVRWPGGIAGTPTATAGQKDIYAFVYSGIEKLYDCIESANFAAT